jgi:hypothetical protein
MKTKHFVIPGILFASFFILNSCDQTNDVTSFNKEVADTNITEQNEAIEDIIEGVFDDIDSYLAADTELYPQLKSGDNSANCPNILIEQPEDTKYPKVILFDYGDENCQDEFGRQKRGRVIVTKTASHWKVGSERRVEFDDFFVNDNGVTGKRKYKNEGKNEEGHWTFEVDVDITIHKTEDVEWTKKTTRTRTLIAGADTRKQNNDDVYLITGTSVYTNTKGYTIIREITTPLYREKVCRFPSSGIVEIVKEKNNTSTTQHLDYGNGECDNIATLYNESGESKEITLGKNMGKYR